jgi:transcriptional regulator with XRE-family HTH domain
MTSRGPGFAALLKDLRTRRGLSQLQLADIAGYSQRHISFLELGRSAPTRGAVLTLAEVVCASLEERNALLRAARYADEYPESLLDGEALEFVLDSCRRTLNALSPFPAILVDRRWEVLALNATAAAFFGQFQASRRWQGAQRNAMRTHFEPGGLRPHIANWPEVARHFMIKVRLRLLDDPSNDMAAGIVRDFADEVGVLSADRSRDSGDVAFTVELAKGRQRYRYQILFAALSDPHDRTAAQLRIETFVPADDATRMHFETVSSSVAEA